MQHPYWDNARQRQREAWLDEIAALVRSPAPKPIRGRILHTIEIDSTVASDAIALS